MLPILCSPKPGTTITEMDASDDEHSLAASANFQMEEADRGLSQDQELQQGFSKTLSNLVTVPLSGVNFDTSLACCVF